jgi:hypothetical protein
MSFNSKFNVFILSEMKSFFTELEAKNDQNSSHEMYEELKKYLNIEEPVETKTKKEKKPRAKKELSDEERCEALKIDKTRCNGKKTPNGVDPTLCPLHNKSGTKSGRVVIGDLPDGQEMETEEPVDVQEIKEVAVKPKKATSKKVKKVQEETGISEDFE